MKTFLCFLAAIVFTALMLAYYGMSNVKVPVKRLQANIAELINLSSDSINHDFLYRLEEIKKSLDSNSLISPELKNWYSTRFIAAWRNAKKLDTPTIAALQTQNNRLFEPLFRSLNGIQHNQLLCCIIISLLFSFFVFMATYTNLLRDVVGDHTVLDMRRASTTTAVERDSINPPFSLSRTQLATWITIIASFYLHAVLWNQCKVDVSINTTALILMGISAGTFAMGAILDTIEVEQGLPRNQDQPASGFFLRDLLTDKNGISIHRLQNLAWTIIAIIVYFYRYNNKAKGADCLPELDSTLLALTGISSATYLTLKTRENTPAKDEVRVHLEPNATAPADTLSLIRSNGFSNATLSISDSAGNLVRTLKTPDEANNFIIDHLAPGNYMLTAEWKTTIDGQDKQLKGTYSGAVDNKTIVPITMA